MWKNIKTNSQKKGLFFWFQERFEYFILPNQSLSADIHINIYEHFPEKLINNTFLKYQHNGIYLQKNFIT